MSGVTLRCPACGTTQSRPGECEACSEGEVRYFCSNHAPGLWLDQPECKACGAKFGEAPRAAAARSRTAPKDGRREERRPDSRLPVPSRAAPFGTVRRRPLPPAEPEDAHGSPSLVDLLAHMADGDAPTRAGDEGGPWPETTPAVAAGPLAFLGCLGRVALAGFVLVLLVLVALFMLAGGMLQ